MIKMFRLVVSAVLIATCVCGGLLTYGAQPAHAASNTSAQQDPTDGHTIPQWVVRADPYVHVLNYVAYIDPAISTHLSSSDVAMVNSSVNYYNALPLETRQFHGTVIVPEQFLHSQAVMSASCDNSISLVGTSWTGAVTVHLSNCVALELAAGEGVDAGVADYIGSIFPPAAPLAAPLTLALGAEAGALGTFASECGDGANFNFMLWNPAIFWPSRDC